MSVESDIKRSILHLPAEKKTRWIRIFILWKSKINFFGISVLLKNHWQDYYKNIAKNEKKNNLVDHELEGKLNKNVKKVCNSFSWTIGHSRIGQFEKSSKGSNCSSSAAFAKHKKGSSSFASSRRPRLLQAVADSGFSPIQSRKHFSAGTWRFSRKLSMPSLCKASK